MIRSYTCGICGLKYQTDRPLETAMNEYTTLFGKNIPQENLMQVCDICYKRIDPNNNPHLVERTVAYYTRLNKEESNGQTQS